MSTQITNPEQPRNNDPLLTATEVAKILQVSVDTLARWRTQGRGPQFIKLGTARSSPVRYRHSVVQAFLDGRLRRSTSDDGSR